MAIAFKKATLAPIQALTANAPNAAVIGVIGETGSGTGALLRLAAGVEAPVSGSVSAGKNRRFLGIADELNLDPVDTLAIEHTLARQDAVARGQAAIALDRLRRKGTTILIASHEDSLLRRLCDEIWWMQDGKIVSRGDPSATLDSYRQHVAKRLRESGEGSSPPITPQLRLGDGRAEIVRVETLGADWKPTMVWRSGETAHVRVTVKFKEEVNNPVIGLLIRNRIGLDVFGTNTQLEKVLLGTRPANDTLRVTFRFECQLCPQDYTLTIASHEADGTRHDWLEEAVSISVTDSRYTAGVANLRAQVTVG